MLLEGESFRMGTFGRLVFCEVRTLIVGKTKFFDSKKTACEGGWVNVYMTGA